VEPPPQRLAVGQEPRQGHDRDEWHRERPAVKAPAEKTTPARTRARAVAAVPRSSTARRPTRRLPATQPAMLAAWRKPTFLPPLRTSSCTARWSPGKEKPMRAVGRPKSRSGRRT
jgi:hypothetical protein